MGHAKEGRTIVRYRFHYGYICVYAVLLLYCALRVFPVWDDAWLMLLIADDARPFSAWRVRPLEWYVADGVIDHGWLFPFAILNYVAVWSLVGLVTLRLWCALFPESKQYALLAASVAMAPLLTTIQLNLIVVPSSVMVSSLAPYLALLFLWTVHKEGRGAIELTGRYVSACVFILLGCLMSEYAVPAGLACGALLAGRKRSGGRGDWIPAALVFGLVVIGYVAYWWWSSHWWRAEVRPEEQFADRNVFFVVGVTVMRLISSVWQGMLGFLLRELSDVVYHRNISEALLIIPSLLVGWIFSLAVFQSGHRREHSTTPARPLVSLLVALVLGLLPIVFMREIGHPSRFWLPLLPVTSCLSIGLLIKCLRARWHVLLPWVIGVLIAHSTGIMMLNSARTARVVERWGHELQDYVEADGGSYTIAIFDMDEKAQTYEGDPGMHTRIIQRGDDYWLTGMLTRKWAPSQVRQFWAFHNWGQADGKLRRATRADEVMEPLLEHGVRGVERRGPVQRVLWVYADRHGRLDVEVEDFPSNPLRVDE